MEEEIGTLKLGEVHPASHSAMAYIKSLSPQDLFMWQDAFASCAIDGNNRSAEICCETLRRLLHNEPVSDRYLLGLAWTIKHDLIDKGN